MQCPYFFMAVLSLIFLNFLPSLWCPLFCQSNPLEDYFFFSLSLLGNKSSMSSSYKCLEQHTHTHTHQPFGCQGPLPWRALFRGEGMVLHAAWTPYMGIWDFARLHSPVPGRLWIRAGPQPGDWGCLTCLFCDFWINLQIIIPNCNQVSSVRNCVHSYLLLILCLFKFYCSSEWGLVFLIDYIL